jgi:hypothetical protein
MAPTEETALPRLNTGRALVKPVGKPCDHAEGAIVLASIKR